MEQNCILIIPKTQIFLRNKAQKKAAVKPL